MTFNSHLQRQHYRQATNSARHHSGPDSQNSRTISWYYCLYIVQCFVFLICLLRHWRVCGFAAGIECWSSDPVVVEPVEVLRDEPKRKRVKKDPVDCEMKDEESEQNRSPVAVDPNLPGEEQQKHQQLAAFPSVLAQQTPLNASTKQKSSSAGPSKQIFFHFIFCFTYSFD